MEPADPTDVRAQLDRLYGFRLFGGAKLRRLLGLIVEEWLEDKGLKLTASYIAKKLGDEEAKLDEDSQTYGYPKTRANLAHVRKRLKKYYETQGYKDPIIIRLHAGSYIPAIEVNPMWGLGSDVDPAVARVILRAKTAIDSRTHKGINRAFRYVKQLEGGASPRHIAATFFIPMAAASVIPSFTSAIREHTDKALALIRASNVALWESTFVEACAEACYRHNWDRALELFELAVATSQGEATYHWWYTALLASKGRIEESIQLLDSALNHFSRTNTAMRSDLAILQIMAGRFEDAEETLLSTLDFVSPDDPLLLCNLMILYEAQDRPNGALDAVNRLLQKPAEGSGRDFCAFLLGMVSLYAGRSGALDIATELVERQIKEKESAPGTSSIDIAIGLIGLNRPDEAVEWLRRAAFDDSDPFAMWFHIFPPLRHLRGHPGFNELLQALKLHRDC